MVCCLAQKTVDGVHPLNQLLVAWIWWIMFASLCFAGEYPLTWPVKKNKIKKKKKKQKKKNKKNKKKKTIVKRSKRMGTKSFTPLFECFERQLSESGNADADDQLNWSTPEQREGVSNAICGRKHQPLVDGICFPGAGGGGMTRLLSSN